MDVVDSLARYGRYDFRNDGLVRIERWKKNRAQEGYKHTLLSVPGKIEAEPPSATMITNAQVSWTAEKASIGMNIRQRHVGTVRKEVRPLVDQWVKVGKPYPSSGGLYYTVPNKSYEKVVTLSTHPELRDAVLNLGIEDEWLRFWDMYLPLRHDVSAQMLSMLQSGVDPEALSRHNEEAGTGLQIRGLRLKRKDLASVAKDLNFLLPYQFAMGVAFAAVQLAPLEPDDVWLVDCYDARVKGAIASRSDIDVMGVEWDGEHLTIEGLSQTRQAGSDSTGVLANSHTERRLMGSSVTEKVLRMYRRNGVEYPFTDKNLLIKAWGLDAKPFPGKEYIIGEDFGLAEPIKSPADALFSRGFLKVGAKIVSMMLSGSNFTQAVYSVFHNHFIGKTSGGDRLLALGDDMNLITSMTEEEIFYPYIKVKSTDAAMNTKKILGQFSAFSIHEDPTGQAEATIGIVPRVLKTVSSATKRSSTWGEQLSDLSPQGELDLIQPSATENAIREDIHVLLPYLQWSGKRRELDKRLQSLWSYITPEDWKILTRYNEELEYRLNPETGET